MAADKERIPDRPPLDRHLSLEDFQNFYWYREELEKFCRENGLRVSGMKADLVSRIEQFLQHGQVDEWEIPDSPKRKKKEKVERVGPITLDTIVTSAYKCDDETRAFFKSVIGEHFHFTAHLQRFRKANQHRVLTYGDLAREWIEEHERRKDKNYKPEINKSWQWNQFVRDFLADREANAGKSVKDAAKAWTLVRDHKGQHTYEEYKRLKAQVTVDVQP